MPHKVGKLQVDFGNNLLWVACQMRPDSADIMQVQEEWKDDPDKFAVAVWEMNKEGLLQDVGRRLMQAERAILN